MKVGIHVEEVNFLCLLQGKGGKNEDPVGHVDEVQVPDASKEATSGHLDDIRSPDASDRVTGMHENFS
jgi:hypothetical protein